MGLSGRFATRFFASFSAEKRGVFASAKNTLQLILICAL
ncbi:hypothetical protein BAA13334_I03253 [Brucella abortus A13334]|nr:hypothetical protein BAA13334_I03253 [Brucella abortus A13334]